MDSNNLKSKVGYLAKTEKLSLIMGWSQLRECSRMLLCGGFTIYIRFFSSKGYSFMFTNSAYEMSMGFSNIRGLTLSTWIFITYIRRHRKWNLIFKGKERANNIFIHKDTSKVYWGKILINKKGKLIFTMIAVITHKRKRHINRLNKNFI